jgi:hypothetical protein
LEFNYWQAGRYFPSDTVRELLITKPVLKNLDLSSPNDILGKTIAFDDGTEISNSWRGKGF